MSADMEQPIELAQPAESQKRFSWLDTAWDYWFDKETWSSYMAFLLLASGVLLLALPNSMEIGNLSPRAFEMINLFPTLFVVLFGILSMTLGQAELSWNHRLSKLGQFIHLFNRVLVALVLTMPLWMVYLMANTISPIYILGIFAHFALFGFVLALFGWRLCLTQLSEIFQFNVKYISYFGMLAGTYFVVLLQFLNPILPLQWLFEEGQMQNFVQLFGFYVSWILFGVVIIYFVERKLKREDREGEAHGREILRDRK
jgi:hypothetical protein